jgi:hypothetical protein
MGSTYIDQTLLRKPKCTKAVEIRLEALSRVVHACNSSTWEVEAEGYQVQVQPELQVGKETLQAERDSGGTDQAVMARDKRHRISKMVTEALV